MKFLEIADGISVKKEEITCVMRVDEYKCTVSTEYATYNSNFSYETMLKLLEMESTGEKQESSVNRLVPANINTPYQFFAG